MAAKSKLGDKPQVKLKVEKRTSQGGKVKRSSMNKGRKRGFKSYRGQGR
jgi:hypothetical protein